jgi:hypothetical protein
MVARHIASLGGDDRRSSVEPVRAAIAFRGAL